MWVCLYALPAISYGDRFIIDISLVIQIRQKVYLAVNQLKDIISLQMFVLDTAVQLPCRVQNLVAITWLDLRWEEDDLLIELVLRWKKSFVKCSPGPSQGRAAPYTIHNFHNYCDPVSSCGKTPVVTNIGLCYAQKVIVWRLCRRHCITQHTC